MKKIILILCIACFITLPALSQLSYEWSFSGGTINTDSGSDAAFDNQGNNFSLLNRYTPAFVPTMFLIKRNETGAAQWTKIISGALGSSVTTDLLGNVYVCGRFNGTVDLDPGSGSANATATDYDYFILKLDASGNHIWSHSFGGADTDEARDVRVDANGNVYITGAFTTTVDFDPGAGVVSFTSLGYRDAFIQKLDNNGNLVWVKQIGSDYFDFGSALTINNSNEVVIAGMFYNTVDFDPNAGLASHTSNGGYDIFIMKLDMNGNYIWSKTIGGTGNDIARDVVFGSTGLIFVTGEFNGTVDFDPGTGVNNLIGLGSPYDAFVLKLDGSGSFQWAHSFGATGGHGAGAKIALDQNENVYIGGSFDETVDFDPGIGTNNVYVPDEDYFVVKLDENGLFQWVINSGGTVPANTDGLAVDANDNVLVVGSFYGTRDFDPGVTVIEMTSIGDYDYFTLLLSQTCSVSGITPDLSTLSDVTGTCDVTSLMAPTASTNCGDVLTGSHNASLPITAQGTTVVTWTYDDGNGNTSTQTQNVVIDDITAPVANVVTLSNITSECSVTSLTAPTATDNCVGSVTGTHNVTLPITASGTTTITWTYDDGNGNTSTQTQNVIITPIDNGVTQVDAVTLSADATGYSYQWIDCNNGNQAINGATSQIYVASTNGNYAVEIDNGTCMVTSNCMVISQVGISEIGDTELVEVYPNPTAGTIHISSSVPFNKVEVMNALGQIVGTDNISETSKYSLTLPEQNGVYFLKIHFDTTTIIKRIVKQ